MAKDLGRRLESMGPFSIECDAATRRAARLAFGEYRGAQGFVAVPTVLLSPPGSNVKLDKSEIKTYGLALAQADVSVLWNLCRWSTPDCRAGCVAKAGKGTLPDVVRARVAKTLFLANEPALFIALLADEIRRAVAKEGHVLVRLNTFADLRWELIAPDLFTIPGAVFYDYTKAPDREETANYALTFSASERTRDADIVTRVQRGERVAVVFSPSRTQPLPATWNGCVVTDGDATDDRTGNAGTIIGLRAKGTMRTAGSAMVRTV